MNAIDALRPPRDAASRTWMVLAIALAALGVLIVVALGSGRYPLTASDVLAVLWKRLSGAGDAGTSDAIVWQIRMPRVGLLKILSVYTPSIKLVCKTPGKKRML